VIAAVVVVVVWEATGRVWAKICRRSMFAQRHRLWLELHVHRRSGPSATPPAHLTRIELVQRDMQSPLLSSSTIE
jgi:hypothetical protein